MSALIVPAAAIILSLCFNLIENAIDPNMSKWARSGFRVTVFLVLGIIFVLSVRQ